MRILMVTPSYYPIKGGAESVIRNLSIKLNQTGVPTDVLTFNMNYKWHPLWQRREERIDGINVFKIPALNLFPISHSDRITLGINLIPGRFRSQLRKYDVIHFHGGDLTFPLFSCFLKRPKVFHLHGLSVNFYKRYFLSKTILKHIADVYICISKRMERELAELGISSNKIAFLPNPLDTDFFHPSGRKDDDLVLFVGRITFDKGLHILLESLTYLRKPIRLVIIGPADWDFEYFQHIMKRIEHENNKGPHKIAYLGPQDQANVIEWYQRAAVFVLPSFREASPMVNLETLSCETPVVASSVGGISEVIRSGENGALVPPNDPLKLAQAVQYLLDHKDVRTKLGRQGRKFVTENFSSKAIVEKLCRIYDGLATVNRESQCRFGTD